MVVVEAAERPEHEARVKAAAWAWYQRSGGSITPTAGRSEAFATRCSTRQTTSRFQREAVLRARILASRASATSDSGLTSFSSIDNSSSLSQCTASYGNIMGFGGDITDSEEISNPDSLNADAPSEQALSLDLVTLHPTACWDCGSSLFDSFELVAMSKQLDTELHEPNIDVELGLYTDSELGLRFPYNQQQVLPLCNTPYNDISPSTSPPRLFDTHDTSDTYDKLVSVADKNSKQAVYDMFCQYGDTAKHVDKQTNKQSTIADIVSCGGETRKHKAKPGHMSFHNIAKALHNIRHPYSQSVKALRNIRHPYSQSVSSPIIAPQDQHHQHHLHYRPHQQQFSTEKVLSAQGNGKGTSRLGDWVHYDDASITPQPKQRHIHHHHHHHYHYLFHSDDDFRLQPLDKSLMVAAAGLRSPKVNPVLAGLDHGRKWADYVSVPSSPGSNCLQ